MTNNSLRDADWTTGRKYRESTQMALLIPTRILQPLVMQRSTVQLVDILDCNQFAVSCLEPWSVLLVRPRTRPSIAPTALSESAPITVSRDRRAKKERQKSRVH
jgi:hypothetical protein